MLSINNEEEMACLKKKLANEFEIKDLGPLKYFLGIEVVKSSHGIFLSTKVCSRSSNRNWHVGM